MNSPKRQLFVTNNYFLHFKMFISYCFRDRMSVFRDVHQLLPQENVKNDVLN